MSHRADTRAEPQQVLLASLQDHNDALKSPPLCSNQDNLRLKPTRAIPTLRDVGS